MHQIETTISRLKLLARYYKGIPEQEEIYSQLLKKLREFYKDDSSAFTKSELDEIKDLKKKIESVSPVGFSSRSKKPEELREGTAVFHKFRYFVGVIDGTTRIKHLFEDEQDDEEFRVRISKEEVKIAAARNLTIIGSGYTNRCYNCKAYVGYSLGKCSKCGWYICIVCGACGCGYHGGDSYKDRKDSQEG
jgi:uncharacterized protein YutD